MARRSPFTQTLRALFARSGNCCALPGCTATLVTTDGLFVGELAHIEAAEVGGPRYRYDSNDEERRAEPNLMLLCQPCHTEVDADPHRYKVALLRKFKADHESRNGEKSYKLDERVLFRVMQDMDDYWANLARVHRDEHIVPDLAVPVPVGATFAELADQAHALLSRIDDIASSIHESDERAESDLTALLTRVGIDPAPLAEVPYYENPFISRHWDWTALALPNMTTRLAAALHQLEVLYFQEFVGTHPGDRSAAERLARAKAQLFRTATTTGLAD